jgi:hypothetical protein
MAQIEIGTAALCEAHVAIVYRKAELERVVEYGERELDRTLARHDLSGLLAAESEILAVLDGEQMKAVAA